MSEDLSAYLVGLSVPLWILAWMIGPARLLYVGIIGNAVVRFPHLSARKRRERWEIWMMLPYIAYVLAWLSGLGVSWMLSDSDVDGVLSLFTLWAGAAIILFTGIFIGLRDASAKDPLSEIEDPNAYLVELKSRRVDGVLGAADVKEAEAHMAKVKFAKEPRWRKVIRDGLSTDHPDLNLAPAPKWQGVWIWRDKDNKKIRIKLGMIWSAGRRDWTLWVALLLSLAPVFALLAAVWWGPWTVTSWDRTVIGLPIVTVGPLVITFISALLGLRVSLINGIRTNLAEQEHKEEIEALIKNSREAHQAPTVREVAQVSVRNVSLFQEILEALHRRYC